MHRFVVGELRKLNEDGLSAFSEFLKNARSGISHPPVPDALLTNAMTSEQIEGGPDLEPLPPTTNGYELARYLHEQFAKIDPALIEGETGLGDRGFWAAVFLLYFDLLTPGYRNGPEKPNAENHFIPETETSMAQMRYYRHRIAGPFRFYKLYAAYSEPFLLSSPGKQRTLYTQISDSVFYTETRCLVEAINLLYFDARKRQLKPGWNTADEPGTFPRLLAVVDQFDLTYDLLGIAGRTLLTQLPEEFDAWKTSNAAPDRPGTR